MAATALRMGLRAVTTVLLLVLVSPSALLAQTEVRVATYNIKWLDAEELPSQGHRQEKLRQVVTLLEADVIGLQEIDDRAALEEIFAPSEWQLVIDDDSGERQDLAVAVRRPLKVEGLPDDLDADDAHFLFPGTLDHFFPDRRDVLAVEVRLPEENGSVTVLVHHAKSRFGGRDATDPRRERAAIEIVRRLERDYHEEDVLLVGDFNDTPDDCSLNILETGNPDAACGPEDAEGPFLVNLTEPLYGAGQVSFGRKSNNVHEGRIDVSDPGARERNNRERGTDAHTGDQLFDQILISPGLRDEYVGGSTEIFDVGVAARGNEDTRASDHLPVFAEFLFGPEAEEPAQDRTLRISALLPDPGGHDAGHEIVTLRNLTGGPVDLNGWRLQDKAGNEFPLSGTVTAAGELKVTMSEFTMPLNNTGDAVILLRPDGDVEDAVTYSRAEVVEGQVIQFE